MKGIHSFRIAHRQLGWTNPYIRTIFVVKRSNSLPSIQAPEVIHQPNGRDASAYRAWELVEWVEEEPVCDETGIEAEEEASVDFC